RVRAIMTPPPTGRQPPARLVPAPRGRNGTPASLHAVTIATTCSVVVGKTTTSGLFFSMVNPSHSYTASSAVAVRTLSGPTIAFIRATRSAVDGESGDAGPPAVLAGGGAVLRASG